MRDGQYQILAICTGNICRSPMAEGILRARLSARAAEFATVGSAGTSAMAGIPASAHSVEVCRQHEMDISGHRSRPLTGDMIDEADLILVMEEHHRQAVLRMRRDAADRTHLVSQFAADGPGAAVGVDDPIGHDLDTYLAVFRRLDEYITRAMPRIEASVAGSSRRLS